MKDAALWRMAHAAGLGGILLVGCGPADPDVAREAAVPPRVVTVMASDYAFDMPDTLLSGATTFRLMNHGQEFHHVQLIRIEDGKTFADFAALPPDDPPPPWLVMVGGPNSPAPGGTSETTVNLIPGAYAVVCFIPSPDGVPHVAKGMVRPLTVIESDAPPPLPEGDVTITLDDYSFQLSAPLTAGPRLVRVETTSEQPHEVAFGKLDPGKTLQDLLAWIEGGEQGPPPGTPMGGTSGVSRGEVNLVSLDLTPGEWVLLCFLPDAGDGQPHLAHGMMTQLTVE